MVKGRSISVEITFLPRKSNLVRHQAADNPKNILTPNAQSVAMIVSFIAFNGFVFINEKKAKASSEIKIGDTISLLYRDEKKKYIVKNIFEFATEEKAKLMYEEIN